MYFRNLTEKGILGMGELISNNNEFIVRSSYKLRGAIHSTKIPTGPTEKRGPPQKVDPFFRNFSGWTELIH